MSSQTQDVEARCTETTALLADESARSPLEEANRQDDLWKQWDDDLGPGQQEIVTTWFLETKILGRYSRSLILTFFLQYSLNVTTVFVVGHLGTKELGAVSLASMTANITGVAVYTGLATSLDTLCAQAYGSGKKELVGLHLQRMIYFLLIVTLPIGVVWLNAARILQALIPEKDLAELAGVYLRIFILGAPGYAAFEAGKRFVQAQGLFHPTLWVLLFCAPVNVLLNWLLVWKFEWGFIGAPIAVVITMNLLPLCLLFYVLILNPSSMECWGGFSRRAFSNWGPMVRLALPGLLMIEAEYLAFEILAFAAAYISAAHLAAQSILITVSTICYQLPYPISVAASTRIGNLIGAQSLAATKTAVKVAIAVAFCVGSFNMILLFALPDLIPRIFTKDEEVIHLAAEVMPMLATLQLFDALTTISNGILRGLGRQAIGGWVNLFCYYVIALPLCFATAFGLRWKLFGLWVGPLVGLSLVGATEAFIISRTNWQRVFEDARLRNQMN